MPHPPSLPPCAPPLHPTRLDRSEGASEAFDMVFHGGKADDITVLVSAMR